MWCAGWVGGFTYGDTVTIELFNPWGKVVEECAEKRITQRSVALTYAIGIRQEITAPAVRKANEAIVARWGARGLARVKALAWDFVDGRRDVVTGKRVPS